MQQALVVRDGLCHMYGALTDGTAVAAVFILRRCRQKGSIGAHTVSAINADVTLLAFLKFGAQFLMLFQNNV